MDSERSDGPSRRPTGQALGVALVLISAAGFGSGALLVQPIYDAGMEPLVVLFWRFVTAALLGWGALALSARARRSARLLTPRRVAVLLFLGVVYVGNSYTYIAALQVVPISLSSIITYLYPAVVAVIATRFVRRLEGRRAWLALALSLLGVALAVGGIPEGGLPPVWGLALAFSSPLIYAVWIVLQARLAGDRPRRRAGRRSQGRSRGSAEEGLAVPPGDAEASATSIPDPAPAAAIMTTATAGAYALLVLGSGRSLSPLDVPAEAWWAILAFGLVATAVAIQAFYAGVKRIGGARAALISTVEPVYTIALAMILFGERLSIVQLAGGMLVIGAVILAESRRPSEAGQPSPAPADRVAADTRASRDPGDAQLPR